MVSNKRGMDHISNDGYYRNTTTHYPTEDHYSKSVYSKRHSEFFESGYDTEGQYPGGKFALSTYLEKNGFYPSLSNVKSLIRRGANVNEVGIDGRTPITIYFQKVNILRHAGRKNICYISLQVFHLLVDSGSKVDILGPGGNWTPLLVSCMFPSNEDMIRRLILPGASINTSNKLGWTPIMRYCTHKKLSIDIIRLLLENGADPNCKLKRTGSSALMLFSSRHVIDTDILRLFIEYGANIRSKNFKGVSCLDKLNEKLGEGWTWDYFGRRTFMMCRNHITTHGYEEHNSLARFLVSTTDDLFYNICKFM